MIMVSLLISHINVNTVLHNEISGRGGVTYFSLVLVLFFRMILMEENMDKKKTP